MRIKEWGTIVKKQITASVAAIVKHDMVQRTLEA